MGHVVHRSNPPICDVSLILQRVTFFATKRRITGGPSL
jgi:hypothetical protein